jgi:hypothetical protein
MSYDLLVFRGGKGDSAAGPYDPLDLAVAREVILASGGIDDFGEELVWGRGTLVVSVLLNVDDTGVLRSVESGIVGDPAPPEQREREFKDVLGLLLRLAERLGAQLYDPQRTQFLDRRDIELVAKDFA